MGTIILIISLLLPFLSLVLLLLCSSFKWKNSSLGPTSYPVIGCLFSFYGNRYRLLDWYTSMLSASPTQTIVVSRLGARRTVITADPKSIKYILNTNFSNFPKGRPFTEILGDFLGSGIFNVDGDVWSSQRKLAIHQFNARSLQDYVDDLLKDEVEKKLLPLLEMAADGAKAVDLQELLRRLAFELICKFSLGYDPCCLEYNSMDEPNPIVEAFDMASGICAKRGAAPLSATWKLKRFFGLGSERNLREAIGRIHEFIQKLVHEKKASSSFGSDFLSKMASDGKQEEEIRDTTISLIMAGRDTTSAAMTWLFFLLSRHPEAEEELMTEVGLLFTDEEQGKLSTLKDLRWLKACICESMRLYPPVAWDSKHAVADDVLPDGTPVRAGDRVTYFPYGMGRMERLWGEDRLEFRPARWISGRKEGRVEALKNVGPYEFPVFQAGPRVCLGKEMAMVQIKYVVASILKRFTITPEEPDRQPVFVPLLTAHMAGGFRVFIRRRQ